MNYSEPMLNHSMIQRFFGRSRATASPSPCLYDKAATRFEPSDQLVWDSPAWVETSARYVEQLRREAGGGRLAPEAYLAPIALLASQLARRRGAVSILDLGGGVGPCVDAIVRDLPNARYVVVDGAASCARGRLMFADDQRVSFFETLPSDGEKFDIGMFSSALQYVDDWRQALAALANRVGEDGALVINRVPVFSRATVALRQNLFLGEPVTHIGSVWHWVFSREELIGEANGLGFHLGYDQFIRDLGREMITAQDLGRVDLRLLMFSRR